jgi:hypothetical protein
MTVTMQHKGTCLNKSGSQRVVPSLAATERFLADFFSRHVTQSESVPFNRPCTHFKTLSILLRLVHAAFSALEIMTFKKNEVTKQRENKVYGFGTSYRRSRRIRKHDHQLS